ncbi:MAG: DUF2878 domain-containing protein [Fuerstiella sp.]|nr:DUF2878 domain-containing protein [Fuerstiella sp.]
MSAWFNLVLYQIGWFACVLGVAWNSQCIGVGVALCLFALHLVLATDAADQIKLAMTATIFGLVVDSVQIRAGVFAFPRGTVVDWLPPPGISILWLQFATTFRYSMSWLSKRYVAGACFGLIGGPLAYFAGERLGAVELLPLRLVNFAVLGLVWSLSVPLLVFLSDRETGGVTTEARYRYPLRARRE